MVRHVWKNYERLAFGKDQLKPVSGKGVDSWGGVGQTLVDSLDTWLGRNMQFNCCKSPYKIEKMGQEHNISPHLTKLFGKNKLIDFLVAQGFGWQVCMKSLTEPRRGQRRVSALTRTWMCLSPWKNTGTALKMFGEQCACTERVSISKKNRTDSQ